MSELAEKLARRRNLNGEGGPGSVPKPIDSKPERKEIAPVKREASSSGSSGADELAKKLARRRSVNGEGPALESVEVPGGSNRDGSTPVSRQPSSDPSPIMASEIVKALVEPSLSIVDDVTPTSTSSSLRDHDGQSTSNDSEPPLEPIRESTSVEVPSTGLLTESTLLESPPEPPVIIDPQPQATDLEGIDVKPTDDEVVVETASFANEAVSPSDPTFVSVIDKNDSENSTEQVESGTPSMADVVEEPANAHPNPTVSTVTEAQSFAQAPEGIDITSALVQSAEATMYMVDQELDMLLAGHHHPQSNEDIYSSDEKDGAVNAPVESPVKVASKMASLDDAEDEESPSKSGLETPPSRTFSTSNSGLQDTEYLMAAVASQSRPSPRAVRSSKAILTQPISQERPPPSIQPIPPQQPSGRSLSPLPFQSTPRADKLSPKSEVTSASSSTQSAPNNSSKSPMNRKAPSSAGTNSSNTNNGGSGSWYPGKYLMEGRWSSSSQRGSNKIAMNKEQAQSFYEDLIISSSTPKASSAANPKRLSPEKGGPGKELSPSTASDVSSTIPPSTSDNDLTTAHVALLAENHRLKREVARLQQLLEEKQSVIDAYELSNSLQNMHATSPKAASGKGGSGSSLSRAHLSNSSIRSRIASTASDSAGEEDEGFGNDGLTRGGGLFEDSLGGLSHRRGLVASSRRLDNLEGMLGLDNSASDGLLLKVSEDDGLEALLSTDKPTFDPLSLGNQADLVRSYTFATSKRMAAAGRESSVLLSGKVDGDDEETSEKSTKRKKTVEGEEGEALTYEEFLKLFARCPDLQLITKSFILSVLGPHGDTSPPNKKEKLDYIFYGTYKLDERCRQFFDDVEQRMKSTAVFRHLNDEQMICARDALEQYVMHRIGQHAYKLTETVEDDMQLVRRMTLLSSFLTPAHLDIKPEYFHEELLLAAGKELKEINSYRTPSDKVACIVKCVTVIFRSLSVARKKQEEALLREKQERDLARGESSPKQDADGKAAAPAEGEESEDKPQLALAGADDFLPLFIWVVLQSKIPRLMSNSEYIQTYLNPARLMGRSGYCLINLRSAIDFVTYIEPSSINIDADFFESKMAEAEGVWNATCDVPEDS